MAARTVSNGTLTSVEIASILPGGIISREGLQGDDVITATGNRTTSSADGLTVALWTAGAGNEAVLKIVRREAEPKAETTPG